MAEADPPISRAAQVMRRGGLVAFPTETVYGLGADASNTTAVRRLFAVKGRPADHPVIAHLAAEARLADWAREVPESAQLLVDAFWPGPLTIVLLRRPDRIVDAVTGGRDTVGLRQPDHPVALALLREFGGAVAAPSANRFGRVSPTTAADVLADLGADVDLVLDGGPCRVGVESTIVDCTGAVPVVLRVGGVSDDQLSAVLGARPPRRIAGEVAAPGTLEAHYAPSAEVVVCDAAETAARVNDLAASGRRVGVLAGAQGPDLPRGTARPAGVPAPGLPAGVVFLDAGADADDYARVLYARLREADRLGLDVVVAVPPPEEGLGAAVADRLRRASARP